MNTKYFIESAGGTYGPADTDQLIQWIAEGRIAPDTMLVDAETSHRIAAGVHGELRSWFPAASYAPVGAPPAPPVAPPPPPQAQSYDTPSQYGQAGGYPPAQREYGGAQQQAYRQPPTAQGQGYYGNAPTPGVGQYTGQYGQNSSGQGAMAQLPQQLQGLNWGSFFLPFWWAIFNQSWIALLLCFIPYVNIIVPFVLLFKGNEWAWQNRRFESPEHFQAVQRSWASWGIALAVIGGIFMFIGIIGAIIGGGRP